MEITGVIYKIEPVEYFGEMFKKRIFSFKYVDDTHKLQYVKFQLSQSNVDLIEGFQEGQKVKVYFRITGREVKNSKQELVIYESKEVYNVEGCEEGKISNNEIAESEYILKPGEKDVELPF